MKILLVFLALVILCVNGLDKQEVLNKVNGYLDGVRAQMDEQQAQFLNPQMVIDLANELHAKNVAAASKKRFTNPSERKRSQTQLDRQAAAIAHAENMRETDPESFNAEAVRGLKMRFDQSSGAGGSQLGAPGFAPGQEDTNALMRDNLKDPAKKLAFHNKVMARLEAKKK